MNRSIGIGNFRMDVLLKILHPTDEINAKDISTDR